MGEREWRERRGKDFAIASIIASRKVEFYLKNEARLKQTLREYLLLFSADEKKSDRQLRNIIGELDNSLFLSETEKASRIIDPKLSISQMNLHDQAIMERLVKVMTLPSNLMGKVSSKT